MTLYALKTFMVGLMLMNELACFKAYDIRGKVPEQLNEDITYGIGRALVAELGGNSYVVGRDMRLESPVLAQALINGLTDAGADVIDIGLCGTEEVYFAGKEPEALADAIQEWLELYKNNSHPRSDDMPWLTWQESAKNLMDIVLGKNS